MTLNYEQLKRLIGYDIKIKGDWWHVFNICKDSDVKLIRYNDSGVYYISSDHMIEIEDYRHKQPPNNFKAGDLVKDSIGNICEVVSVREIGNDIEIRCIEPKRHLMIKWHHAGIFLPHFEQPKKTITIEEATKLLEEAGHKNIIIE